LKNISEKNIPKLKLNFWKYYSEIDFYTL